MMVMKTRTITQHRSYSLRPLRKLVKTRGLDVDTVSAEVRRIAFEVMVVWEWALAVPPSVRRPADEPMKGGGVSTTDPM